MSAKAKVIDCLNGRLIEDLQMYQTTLSSFGMVAEPVGQRQLDAIAASRSEAAELVSAYLTPDKDDKEPIETEQLCSTQVMAQGHFRVWLGMPVLPRSADDLALIKACEASIVDAKGPALFHDIAVLALYLSPHEMPIVTPGQLSGMNPHEVAFYLSHLLSRPVLTGSEDEARYAEFAPKLLDWLSIILPHPTCAPIQSALLEQVKEVNLGEYYVAELDAAPLLAKRRALLDKIKQLDPKLRKIPAYQPPAKPASQTKTRVGFLARTLKKGPDSESLYALFREFDTEKFEIFAYTIDHFDRVVKSDKAFDAAFDKVLSGRRLLRYVHGTGNIVERLRDDKLDIFILANSTHFGVGTADLLISHRVAPIQISSNTVNPLPTSVGTFDHFLTTSCTDPEDEIAYSDIMEPPIYLDPTSICYPFGLGKETKPVLGRATIGLTDEHVMFYNGSSLDRLREPCLRAYMQIVKNVENAKLVLAPFNSGWSGNLHSNIFWSRLRSVAADLDFPMSDVVITNELTLAEARNLVELCDVYLTTWPHGGATTVTLALDKSKPVIARKRVSSRSIDQFLISSVGLDDLIAKDDADFVRIATELGRDPARRAAISAKIDAFDGPLPFFDVDGYSSRFQQLLEQVVAEDAAKDS